MAFKLLFLKGQMGSFTLIFTCYKTLLVGAFNTGLMLTRIVTVTGLSSYLNWDLLRVFFLGCELAECVVCIQKLTYSKVSLLLLDSMALEDGETTLSCQRGYCKGKSNFL